MEGGRDQSRPEDLAPRLLRPRAIPLFARHPQQILRPLAFGIDTKTDEFRPRFRDELSDLVRWILGDRRHLPSMRPAPIFSQQALIPAQSPAHIRSASVDIEESAAA